MQARFEISGENFIDPDNSVLVAQTGPGYFAYAFCDTTGSRLGELKWFDTNNTTLSAITGGLPALKNSCQKKRIIFDYPVYSLLPVELNHGDNSALLHLAGGNIQDHILTEIVGKQIALNYSVPFALLNQCIADLPGASYWHLQSVRITEALHQKDSAAIYVNIVDNNCSVVVTKEGKLLLAQYYTYRAPEDLLFYLLKIAEVHDLSQQEAQLQISGLVEADSKLYRLLYDYFLNIHLQNAGWATNEQSMPVPAHYFTTLKQAAACAL
ncbi:DUF3822 family protein [Niabella soli]|uniref:DUF3822 domain-containing protein n=1 Tax=Niabella soli DSM 19437 TaxID=929713 RepID=W0F2K4_9BACT|nr:DUF3822 family protein [Niabella soli]AHF17247.1 hypothetical protein NIASO_04535 [Niabella soli DSM 19437]